MAKKSINVTRSWIDISEVPLQKNIDDALGIDAIDHIELYVGNAKQAVFYFSKAFGMSPFAYRGPETGFREAASYALRQGEIVFVLTTPLSSHHPISSRLLVHADTVHSIALRVPDCSAFYKEAMKRGAQSADEPHTLSDPGGELRSAAIRTYGDCVHTIVERESYKGVFWPGFCDYTDIFPKMQIQDAGLIAVDHLVGNVELGKMNHWVAYYEKILGFTEMIHFSDKEISTEYSALMSKVMRDGSGKIKFPINEPASGKRKSQIEEYLNFHNGPGVQHIALRTNNIIDSVTRLKTAGVNFLKVPSAYYDQVPERVGAIKEDLKRIAELGILVDRDDDGYLLQVFTKPVQDRPTLFFEIIQREGSLGFGAGNFKALFEALEREQEQRGNL
jgi:4-hydroxyphenylpyruvate dioxygenase